MGNKHKKTNSQDRNELSHDKQAPQETTIKANIYDFLRMATVRHP
jgi:hypothetical protein